jgi:hypothetical protein
LSYLWSFHSFDADRLATLFADPRDAPTTHVLELTQWEGAGFDDPEYAATIAAEFVGSGLSYEGLDARATRVADEVVMLIFSPEGFEEELQVEHISPDGLQPTHIKELLGRTERAHILPLLVAGRRAGQEQSSDCEYCVLSPDEVTTLLEEVDEGMSAQRPWSIDYGAELLDECLREPMRQAQASHRWVYCQLS